VPNDWIAVPPAHHGHHVEAQIPPAQLVRGEPAQGEPPQPNRLRADHGFGGITEAGARAGLHLADDKRVTVGGDDVDLALGAAPVAVQHPQPRRLQVPRGHLLAEAPDRALDPSHRASPRPGTTLAKRAGSTGEPGADLWTPDRAVDGCSKARRLETAYSGSSGSGKRTPWTGRAVSDVPSSERTGGEVPGGTSAGAAGISGSFGSGAGGSRVMA
jgi:hypothetical protein